MNKSSILVALALTMFTTESAWSEETTTSGTLSERIWSGQAVTSEPAAPTEPAPAPVSPTVPGGQAQTLQQPRYWRAPQPFYGQAAPRYPQVRHYPGYPAQQAPVARENPLSAELKQTQEQLAAKNSELDEAHEQLEQLRGQLQDSHMSEQMLSDKATYLDREQNALRVRVTDLVKTLNNANATLEQQRQLINDLQKQNKELTTDRDQLRSEVASKDELLAALQSEREATMQALEQARIRADNATEELRMHRDELDKLEAALQRRETTPQSE